MIRIKKNKGFTIFIAIALTGTLLLIATSIVSLALKQKHISNSERDSQAAFYAADSGMECALYWDVKNNGGADSAFSASGAPVSISCNQDASNPNNHWMVGGSAQSVIQYITFLPNSQSCAKVIVTKNPNGSTQIESFGYNTCDPTSSQRVERAVRANYGGEAADPLLQITKFGNGSGTVSNGGSISCGGSCSATFPIGTIVALNASRSAGSVFAGWSGACSGAGACNVTMSNATSVGATFNLDGYLVDYLVVAGGGGGGSGNSASFGGSGGAGGFRTGTLGVTRGSVVNVTVGTGGTYTNSDNMPGGKGGDSTLGTVTSTGGGGGSAGLTPGGSGGSGGGGSYGTSGQQHAGGAGNTPSVTPSQGNTGGNYVGGGQSPGGGGAGGAASGNTAGVGASYSITGSPITYGAGGQSGVSSGVNTGNGGSGGRTAAWGGPIGSSGASGIVIIRAPVTEATSCSGACSSVVSGSYKIYTFTGNGTFTP